jgi:hypothetical protein
VTARISKRFVSAKHRRQPPVRAGQPRVRRPSVPHGRRRTHGKKDRHRKFGPPPAMPHRPACSTRVIANRPSLPSATADRQALGRDSDVSDRARIFAAATHPSELRRKLSIITRCAGRSEGHLSQYAAVGSLLRRETKGAEFSVAAYWLPQVCQEMGDSADTPQSCNVVLERSRLHSVRTSYLTTGLRPRRRHQRGQRSNPRRAIPIGDVCAEPPMRQGS